jgi:predicted flap endonuclease-1-like 5' DNA nuclease
MQEFFMDYGLWLLIALLVVIVLVFLFSGRGRAAAEELPAEPVVQSSPLSKAEEPVSALAVPQPAPALADPTPAPVPVEPVAITRSEPVANPVPPEPAPVSPAVTSLPEEPDDLLRLKGVGPKLKALLIDLGVTRYAQIAAWTDSDIAAIDARLGTFKGRPVRDQWVDQARYLAAGDIAGFEAKYGKL